MTRTKSSTSRRTKTSSRGKDPSAAPSYEPHAAPPQEPLTPWNADRARVANVVRHVSLQHVHLAWSQATLRCAPADVPAGWAADADVRLNIVPADSLGDSGEFEALAGFQASWSSEDLDADEPACELTAFFNLGYTVPLEHVDDVEPEDIAHFCVFNATFNAWPYWREFAQSTTARMGLTPLVLEVLKVPGVTSATAES